MVGTSTLTDDKNGTHAQVEVCNVSLENFDAALACWATSLDWSGGFTLKHAVEQKNKWGVSVDICW